MKHLKYFVQLTRLDKPIGFLLLFWPCLWGLTLAYQENNNLNLYIKYIILFFFGSVLMRSAGCIINDIVDRKFDKLIKRTKSRPIPSGKISISRSLVYSGFICLMALIILLQFNYLTIWLGIFSMFLAFTYPFMKRFTYWPQLFLGLTFNWGIIMAWTSFNNNITAEPIILYLSAIFWTLGYDTIYGLQDVYDDEIIGLKSTSIKFKKNVKFFVGICYFLFVLFLLILSMFLDLNYLYFLMILVITILLIHQLIKFNKNSPDSCLKVFKSNNLIGLSVFIMLMTINKF